ncbi:MAG: FmdB family zinc ribbon protein [Desulfuromonadaceae bacterium]
MPIYDFLCDKCGRMEERIKKPNETSYPCRDLTCNGTMKRQFHSRFGINMGPVGAHGRWDETLGVYVSTNKQHEEEMRKQGVSLKGDTPKPDGLAWV